MGDRRGFIPASTRHATRALASDETACILDTRDADVRGRITVSSIPRETDFSSVIEHTRLDSRSPEVALMTTSAYAE